MARSEGSTNGKGPVRLREQLLSDGRKSLYLDIYDSGHRSYRFLKLYLLPENDIKTKIANENTLRMANQIKSEMILDITNSKGEGIGNSHKAKMLFVDWVRKYKEDVMKRSTSIGAIDRIIDELENFAPSLTLEDVDETFVTDFYDYLRTLENKSFRENRYHKRKKITTASAFGYITIVRAALNYAVRENVIRRNPYEKIKDDLDRGKEHIREYLTVSEVKKMASTPWDHIWLKKAFMFSCFCGLRLSDIRELKWKNLVKHGDDWQIEIIQFKTKALLYLPLNMNARKWLPEQEGYSPEDKIFSGFRVRHTPEIQQWAKKAGINKKITFHSARHTFATLCLTAGIDIYTTSQLLGHANIFHTQRYARIIDSRKDKAIESVDKGMEEIINKE
jgi:integrase